MLMERNSLGSRGVYNAGSNQEPESSMGTAPLGHIVAELS